MRRTKKINGHYRKRKKNAPQFGTVAEMLAHKAEQCRKASNENPLHQYRGVPPEDPTIKAIKILIEKVEEKVVQDIIRSNEEEGGENT